jgi:DNA-binding transcriptional MerR regulator
MSIGEFARRSRLSAKALRLYDGLGLLSPARVDELHGASRYAAPKPKDLRRSSPS